MKHILEFSSYGDNDNNSFRVIRYEDNFDDLNAVNIDVYIESNDGNELRIFLGYDIFLDFIQKDSPQLKSYISDNHLNNFEMIFDDLMELGFDFGVYIQKWVDKNITSKNVYDFSADADELDIIGYHENDEEGENN